MPTNSVATTGGVRLAVVHPQVVDPVRVDVAGQHHRVGHLAGRPGTAPAASARRRTPATGPSSTSSASPGCRVNPTIPIITCWASTFQVAGDCSSAAFSQSACRAPSSVFFGSRAASFRSLRPVAVRLVGAVLAGVEHLELGQPAERGPSGTASCAGRGAATGGGAASPRSTPGRRWPAAPGTRPGPRPAFSEIVAGVVVVELVVVPGDEPRAPRVHRRAGAGRTGTGRAGRGSRPGS